MVDSHLEETKEHWKEMYEESLKIVRPRQIYTGHTERHIED